MPRGVKLRTRILRVRLPGTTRTGLRVYIHDDDLNQIRDRLRETAKVDPNPNVRFQPNGQSKGHDDQLLSESEVEAKYGWNQKMRESLARSKEAKPVKVERAGRARGPRWQHKWRLSECEAAWKKRQPIPVEEREAITQQEAAELVGRSRGWVRYQIRLKKLATTVGSVVAPDGLIRQCDLVSKKRVCELAGVDCPSDNGHATNGSHNAPASGPIASVKCRPGRPVGTTKIQKDLDRLREYDEGRRAGKWSCVDEFAYSKRLSRSAMSRSLNRARKLRTPKC
jgi:hypothetical protein